MRYVRKLFFLTLVCVAIWGCAKPGSLSGGPKDKTPPSLDTIKSTPNFQTNFIPQKILLYFNEWISLKKKDQILISPPLDNRTDISFRGKHVSLEFNEKDTLKPNTTYSINFGKSIVDFTEGNPVPNFVFIFSTGDKIDSLEIKGKVINSFDEKPMKNITVLLYDSEEDSVVVKSKPYYFANSNKAGEFKISHIKEGKYKLFALKDGNANYLYDLETEEIGYLDSMIHIKSDSLKKSFVIKMFKPTPIIRVTEKSIVGYGKIKITYNRKPDSLRIINSSVDIYNHEILNDSLIIWFDNNLKNDSINLILKNEIYLDTLILKTRKKFITPISLIHLKSKESVKLHPDKSLNLEFNQEFVIDDSTKVLLIEQVIKEIKDTSKTVKYDTTETNIDFTYKIDSVKKRNLKIYSNWQETKVYKFKILPDFLKSRYDVSNDTIDYKITIDKKENYSNLICHLDSLVPNKTYVVLLKLGKNTAFTNTICGISKKNLYFSALKPGKYTLEIIEDNNGNGKWDGGDYFKKLKAEKRYIFTLSDLKANWNQEEDINLNSKKKKNDIKK